MKVIALSIALCLVGLPVRAQEKAPAPQAAKATVGPLLEFDRMALAHIQDLVLRSAEKMPEEGYAFRPVDSVRTYGQMLAHIADAQYLFGSLVLGEANPSPGIEAKMTTKPQILAALRDAFAYSARAAASLDGVSALQTVKLFGGDAPKASVITVNNIHTMEHYGNLVTYLRMKGLVPPSSEKPMPATK
jgi:uncharacterized damage-inducible protein DinB